MPDRRAFVKSVTGATAGLLAARRGLGQGRRQVRVGGQPAKVVDVHAHCAWPEVGEVVQGTSLAGDFTRARVVGPERLEVMDARGIDIQVLSINQYWWYAADRDLARRIVALHDQKLAEWCEAHPDRFVALTSVALQHPDLAAEQLEHAVKELGFRGASVGGHVQGEPPSSPRFDPFWAKAQELGVPVLMHPGGAENVVREGGLEGRGNLGNIIGNPLETTVFLSQMIFEGALDRFPGLRLCGSHGAGYLPSYLGRTEVACEVRERADCANKRRPSEYVRTQILADTLVFSEEGLRHLVAEMGASQVVYGTDLPFNWPDTLDLILDSPSLNDAEKRAILGGNSMELLRIPV